MDRSESHMKIDEIMNGGVRFGTSGVRGLVTGMTDRVCYAYTAAFLKVMGDVERVALAIDLRPSSPRIATACVAAIRDAGARVDYCGPIPTPALAFYAQAQGVPAVMVTGSHIPFDRNGIKFYGRQGEITKEDEARIATATVPVPEVVPATPLPDSAPAARSNYIERYLSFFPDRCLAGMRLGFYEHSSVARDLLRELLERLGAQVISLGRTDDFVPIDTEAVAEADVQRAGAWAREYRFDAILSTDGDADRPLLGDEAGRWLRGDVAGILCARYLGAQAVVTTVNCNTALELSAAFPMTRRTRIGSPFVIAAMDELQQGGCTRVVGFEPNGGFLVGSAFEKDGRVLSSLQTRDAALPILCLLAMAREGGNPVSRLTAGLPARFTASDRIQDFPTESSLTLLAKLSGSLAAIADLCDGLCEAPEHLDLTDGLRILFENGELLHFRPSGNAPELRCYAESTTPERARELVAGGLRRIALAGARQGG